MSLNADQGAAGRVAKLVWGVWDGSIRGFEDRLLPTYYRIIRFTTYINYG